MSTGPATLLFRRLRRLAGPSVEAEDSDAQLLGRFVAEGAEDAFERLFERHAPMVLGVCRRLLRDPHQIDDAFQATFLILVRKAASIHRRESVGSWLHGVARRVALRARAHTDQPVSPSVERFDMHAVDPGESLAWSELRAVLDDEVQNLPGKYRDPVVLCYLEGKTNEQAARQLGCPIGTVFTRLARGREMLRRRLDRRGLALPAVGIAALCARHATAAVPSALASATLQAAAAGSAAMAPGAARLVEETIHAMAVARRKFVMAAMLFLCVAGVTMAAVVGGMRNSAESQVLPRRLLTIGIRTHLYAAPVDLGSTGQDLRTVSRNLQEALGIAPSQAAMLTDTEEQPEPVIKPVFMKTVADFLDGSRSQDRIVVLFAGHACEHNGRAYLMPFEGNPYDADTLISMSWLYDRLAACPAREKVLIVDICRMDGENGARRGETRMGRDLASSLAHPPEGVTVWSSCSEGQSSSTGPFAGGSVFLHALNDALAGPAEHRVRLAAPSADDSLPFTALAQGDDNVRGVLAATTALAERKFKMTQTPKLVGQPRVDGRADEDRPPASTLRIDFSPAREQWVKAIFRSERSLEDLELSAHDVRGSLEELRSMSLDLQRRVAKSDLYTGETRELLDSLTEDGGQPHDPSWRNHYLYELSRVLAQSVRDIELATALGHVRADELPGLGTGTMIWELKSQAKLHSGGVEGKIAKESMKRIAQYLEELAARRPQVPWNELAKRDGLVNLGYDWVPLQ